MLIPRRFLSRNNSQNKYVFRVSPKQLPKQAPDNGPGILERLRDVVMAIDDFHLLNHPLECQVKCGAQRKEVRVLIEELFGEEEPDHEAAEQVFL